MHRPQVLTVLEAQWLFPCPSQLLWYFPYLNIIKSSLWNYVLSWLLWKYTYIFYLFKTNFLILSLASVSPLNPKFLFHMQYLHFCILSMCLTKECFFVVVVVVLVFLPFFDFSCYFNYGSSQINITNVDLWFEFLEHANSGQKYSNSLFHAVCVSDFPPTIYWDLCVPSLHP